MDKNQLYYGDNLEVLRSHIPDESVDLCYIDPPFNSKRNYNQIYNNIGKDDIAQASAFVDTWSWTPQAELYLEELYRNPVYTRKMVETIIGFEKILGKGSMLAYLVNMTIRIAEIWRTLKPTGSFYLHCDTYASHYLKIIIDSIFVVRGGDFRNEIIWYYPNSGFKARSKKFHQVTDSIFWYTKSDTFMFNHLYRSIEPTKQAKRKFNSATKKADVVRDENGKPVYILVDKVLENSLWTIPMLNTGKERIGYATQKPEGLLERIVRASSNEGDVVMDCYCGCGTSVAVAQRLNRRWIGIDITYNSISVILKRFEDTYGKKFLDTIATSGMPRDLEAARALALKKDDRLRKEFEKWVILTYTDNYAKINDKKGADKGKDGVAYFMGGFAIFSVKSGGVSVKDVRELSDVVNRDGASAGILLTLEKPTKPMLEWAAAAGYAQSPSGVVMANKIPKLQIVTIQAMLDGARMNLPLPEPVIKKAERAFSDDKQGALEL